jgi:hypothetical protein
MLDGIPVFSPYHSAGLFTTWNPDAMSRVQLWSSAPSPAFPDALSGTVSGYTRPPGSRIQLTGSASTTQARMAIDGPVGRTGLGFLLSVRQGFPGMVAPADEASYLTGEANDWLMKLEGRLFGGSGGVLGYGSGNEVSTASVAAGPEAGPDTAPRHSFEWNGFSLGGWWNRVLGGGWTARLSLWQARGIAGATWWGASADEVSLSSSPVELGSTRRDLGWVVQLDRKSGSWSTLLGIRGQRTRTLYDVASSQDSVHLQSTAPGVALFALQSVGVGTRFMLTAGGALSAYDGKIHPAPRLQLRWAPSRQVAVTGSLSRSHQFAQSLRNPESVVGNVFPADLYLGAGTAGVPVAQSDLAVLSADYRPTSGVRAGVQAYARRFEGLVLVAPRDGGPFASHGFGLGTGHARGGSVDLAVGTARTGILASYGLQHTRYVHERSSYAPDHGAAHRLEGGLVYFPGPTVSLRLGSAGIWGRRAALVRGGLEWESCNLLDRGCEFSGAPVADTSALGISLPAYFRIDLSARKHWHLQLGGRDASVALFATVTNLFGRRNLLASGVDPGIDASYEIEMRPRAPLVVGLDWRY